MDGRRTQPEGAILTFQGLTVDENSAWFSDSQTFSLLGFRGEQGPPAATVKSSVSELLVQFRPGTPSESVAAAIASSGADISSLVRSDGSGDLLVVSVPQGRATETVMTALARNPNVAFVEPNSTISVQGSNDPSFTSGGLWGLYGDQTSPSNIFGSQAAENWPTQTGSMKSVIGVIDSGVDYTHPDLYLNIWLNPGEIPKALGLIDTDGDQLLTFRDLNQSANATFVSDINGNGRIDAGDLLNDVRWENGIDDDANGRIDDLIGWDFAGADNDPMDVDGHGTHVAGTIGAMGNNGIGVVGVNWQIQLMALKFLDDNGSGTLDNAIRAVDYYTRAAQTHDSGPGNYVATNNSWGGGGYSQALLDSIVNGARADVLFIAAAGNGGSDGIGDNNDSVASYPSNYSTQAAVGWDAVVAVAAIASNGGLASWSNFGQTTVDLAAPGVGILSTVPGGGYATFSGTSMAAPHVSGAIGLLAAANDSLTGAQMRNLLLSTAEATTSVATKTVTGGRLDITDLLIAGTGTQPPTTEPSKILYGTIKSDTLSGGSGNDVLSGVPATGTHTGRGTIDRLTGGLGNDLFILGDTRGRFYDDGKGTSAGTTDYALIRDFAAGDQIQLAPGNYFLRSVSLSGVTGIGIYHDSNRSSAWDSRDELIGIVQGLAPTSADFIFG